MSQDQRTASPVGEVEARRYAVLIVDDTPGNIQVVASVLGAEDYDLSFAISGPDALELVATESFDLILLDVMMPGMTGFEVAERLKADAAARHIPLIFLTAKTDEESISTGFAVGGVDYIAKPFNQMELLARLRHHLEFHRQQHLIEEHNRWLKEEVEQRRRAERKTAAALKRLADFVGNIEDIACLRDLDGRPRQVNTAFVRLTGITEEQLTAQPHSWLKVVHPDDQRMLHALFAQYPEGGPWLETEYRITDSKGGWRRIHARMVGVGNEQDGYSGYHCVERDVTKQRLSEEQRLHYLANYDSLTGLPNRSLLRDRTDQAVRHLAHSKRVGALMVIGCNRMRQVNDSLGHGVGDRLLQEAGKRIGEALREGDTVARIEGDSFAVLIKEMEHSWQSASIAVKLLAALNRPFMVDGYSLSPGGAAGIAIFPQDAEEFDTLLHQASAAMGHARREAGQGYKFYTREMTELALERMLLESDFHLALQEGQFVAFYQPQVDLTTTEMFGAEVLIRWQHPQLGLLSPDRFIPFAEESGLVIPMTHWLIDEVARQMVQWQQQGLAMQQLAINLSPVMFRDNNPCAQILEVLQRHQLPPSNIELEITEGLILEDADSAMATFWDLRQQGFQLAIDDFGTGYSSLSYLSQLPIHKLKIDRSFICGVPGNANDETLTRTIIQLGQGLGLRVIAEGVETEAQEHFLRQLGCHEGQGWLYGKAMPPQAFAALLREHQGSHHLRERTGGAKSTA